MAEEEQDDFDEVALTERTTGWDEEMEEGRGRASRRVHAAPALVALVMSWIK